MRIETERLLLRPMTVQDVDLVVELHRDPAIIEFLGPATPERARERLEFCERAWDERGHDLMAAIERSSGRFLGRIGLRYWPQFGETECGWALHREATGQGYATEAARAVIDWGFRTFPLPYISAIIRPDNSRSMAVARRLGLTPVRDDVLHEIPVIVHAIDRERWGASPRTDEVHELLAQVAEWAQRHPELAAVGAVGSAGTELMLLSPDPACFLDTEEWAGELGGAAVVGSARRGSVIEHDLRTSSGLDLTLVIGPAERDSLPAESVEILYDPDGTLARLTASS